MVGSSNGANSSPISDHSHKASLAACIAAMYSLSIIDNEMISCFLEDHDTAPPSIKKVYPEIALQSSTILLSTSAYPISALGAPPYVSHKSFVLSK